jgi:hypothetical protein
MYVCRICSRYLAESREEIQAKEQSYKNLSTSNITTSSKEATKLNNHRIAELHREKKR